MTEKRFTLVKCYNEQWGVVDKSLEEIDQLVLITTSKSGTGYLVNELNKLFDENEQLKSRFHRERELAMRLSRECDALTIKKQELELEIIRLEEIIKTGKR